MKNLISAGSELSRVLLSFKRELLWVGIFSMIANLLMLTPTLYMLQIFDRILISRSELTLFVLTAIVLCLFFLMAFAEWLRSRLLVRVGIKLDYELNTRVFNTSFESALSNTRQNPLEAFSDLTNMRQFVTGAGVITIFDLPWVPVYIFVAYLLHPLLGLLTAIFCLLQMGMAYLGYRTTFSSVVEVEKAEKENRQYLYAKLKNVEPVVAMGMLDNLKLRWLEHHENLQRKTINAGNKQNIHQGYIKFIRYTMQSLTLAAGAILVIDGQLSAGAMVAANFLVARALYPLDQIVGSWNAFLMAKQAYRRLENLLNDYPAASESNQDHSFSGAVTLNQLSAISPKDNKIILHEISAKFQPGQVTAIIGPSGSGKSTLARCLVGVWPQVKGTLLLDEIPIENWDRNKLGTLLGYLPQDVELLDGTVAENIARFYDVDSDKVIEAAKLAGIHHMILKFPKGYDTPLGEAGSVLSGGQRQRIGLARAIYGGPSLIVLDEPNANLDEAGERALSEAIQNLKAQGKTIFLITHRQNILSVADYLMVLKAGRVAHYGLREEVTATLKELVAINQKPSQEFAVA